MTPDSSNLQRYPKSRTIEIRGQVQGSVDFKEINDTKLVFSADYKMADVYHKSDIPKFLESIGKKGGPLRPRTKTYAIKQLAIYG
jgi:hypothetical protein